MITGKIEIINNQIVFYSEGSFYIIPCSIYNPNRLNKQYKAKVNTLRRTVEEFYET